MANPGTVIFADNTRIADGAIVANSAVRNTPGETTVNSSTTAGSAIEGIAAYAAEDGGTLRVIYFGDWVPAISGGTITVGAALTPDSSGRLVSTGTGTGIFNVGTSRTAAAAADEVIYIRLHPNAMNFHSIA